MLSIAEYISLGDSVNQTRIGLRSWILYPFPFMLPPFGMMDLNGAVIFCLSVMGV
jgi:hypothetical protein